MYAASGLQQSAAYSIEREAQQGNGQVQMQYDSRSKPSHAAYINSSGQHPVMHERNQVKDVRPDIAKVKQYEEERMRPS